MTKTDWPFQRWGHLKRIRVERNPVLARGLRGKEYDTGDRGAEWWVLVCDCGFEFRYEAANYPGRRLMQKSCMRPECPYNIPEVHRPPGRPQIRDASTPVTIYMPMALHEEIRDLSRAEREFTSFSHAAVTLLERGLKDWRESKKDKPE